MELAIALQISHQLEIELPNWRWKMEEAIWHNSCLPWLLALVLMATPTLMAWTRVMDCFRLWKPLKLLRPPSNNRYFFLIQYLYTFIALNPWLHLSELVDQYFGSVVFLLSLAIICHSLKNERILCHFRACCLPQSGLSSNPNV